MTSMYAALNMLLLRKPLICLLLNNLLCFGVKLFDSSFSVIKTEYFGLIINCWRNFKIRSVSRYGDIQKGNQKSYFSSVTSFMDSPDDHFSKEKYNFP
jgi:hypothetical protein